jgi:hypothetical protein
MKQLDLPPVNLPWWSVLLVTLILLGSCKKDAFFDALPTGTFTSNDHSITLSTGGSFILENYPNAIDYRSFRIEGTYTYTRDLIDKENDSYGKITFFVKKVVLDGIEVAALYLDKDESALSLTVAGDDLEGWWTYSDNISWGGKMRIWFNWPGIARATNFYDGHNELFSGDP